MKTGVNKGLESQKEMPPCMILCGGMGTRISDVTKLVPKPMVPIGPHPIIWHIMKSYAAYGVKRFILCLGYRREAFIDYFLNYHERLTDITINLSRGKNIIYHTSHTEEDWTITLAYTNMEAMTGWRVFKASNYLLDSDNDFFLTYGDAVSNVNIGELYSLHKKLDKEITITSVYPSGRFGIMKVKNAVVTEFVEKPHAEKKLINGGFMVLKKSFIKKYLSSVTKALF